MKKTALAPALIALSVAVTSLAVFAGPSGDGHHGGHHGGGDGKNGNDNGDGKNGGGGGDGKNGGGDGKNGGGDGKNGGGEGKNGGGGGGGGGNAGGGEGDRCDAYRNFMYYRHCLLKERRRFVRVRMVPCMQGDAIVYDYGCGQRVVYVPRPRRVVYVQQPVPDYYAQGPAPYVQEQVVVRKSYRKLSRRERMRLRQQIVVANTGAYRDYGYDSGYGYNYGGMSRAARMQQERRLRKRMATQYDYSYGYANGYGYGDDYGYVQPRVHHHRKKRRYAMPVDYGVVYDPGITIHYGPTVLKNGAY